MGSCEDRSQLLPDLPMPLTALVRQLQQAALTGEVLARLARP